MLLLDSDVLIEILRGHAPAVQWSKLGFSGRRLPYDTSVLRTSRIARRK